MQIIRRISQILFIVIFFVLFLLATYPFNSFIPVDIFLRLDPLLGLSTSLASRSFILKTLPSIFLLIMTIFLGRFFCGWICPMGTSIDGFDNLCSAKSDNDKHTKVKNMIWSKYALLTVIGVTAVFSVQISGFFDPISIFTRTFVTVIYPMIDFIFQGGFGFLYQFIFLEDIVFKIEETLRGTVLPLNPVAFRGSMLIGLIFLMILSLAFLQKRSWCRNFCPLGALLALFSKFRGYRRRVSDDCTSCKLCYKNCRMGAIHSDYVSTDHLECINCMDCQKICPVNAIHFGFVYKPESAPVNFERRRILGAGLSGFLALSFLKIGMTHPVKKGKVIRPPGSLEESVFLDRCIRCGECIRICSTAGKGLHYSALESRWEGLATPILLTPAGYCEYNCNLCGQVCPTGAIHPLTLEEKHETKMGTAHFDKTRCIPWYYGEDCMVCEEHCPVPDKAIKFREENLLTIDGMENNVLLPYVLESDCIGCGICTSVCPLDGEKGIYLTNTDEMRWEG